MKVTVLQSELQRLAAAHRGPLTPRVVVEAARPVGSALHPFFEWNEHRNSEAYLLHQARQLIARVTVVYPVEGIRRGVQARVFIHLHSDKVGYRTLARVMTYDEQRIEFVLQALNELKGFRERYH